MVSRTSIASKEELKTITEQSITGTTWGDEQIDKEGIVPAISFECDLSWYKARKYTHRRFMYGLVQRARAERVEVEQ